MSRSCQWHNGQWLQGSTVVNNGAQGRHDHAYDALHRLTSHSRNGNTGVAESVTLKYDAIGNLTSKSDYSADSTHLADAYSYVSGTHRLDKVQLRPNGVASFTYDQSGNVTERNEPNGITRIQYDVDNLARRITRGANISDFYEAPGGRWLQRLGTRDTWMLEKTYEREVVGNQVTVERYYIANNLLTIKPSTNPGERRKLNYMHRDRLGSPVSITEKPLPANGSLGNGPVSLVEHRGFDPFGKAYDGQWGLSNLGTLNLGAGVLNTGVRNQRGFTGHEHLDEFALIHMNGRLYDHNVGRFLGVDPFIQFPSNSQSLNPYAYLMNNPLAGTDPTGYVIWFWPAAATVGKWLAGAGAVAGAGAGGYAAGSGIYEVASGNKSVGQAVVDVGTEVAINTAYSVAGLGLVKAIDRMVPDSIKRSALDQVEKIFGNKGDNGAQTTTEVVKADKNVADIGSNSQKDKSDVLGDAARAVSLANAERQRVLDIRPDARGAATGMVQGEQGVVGLSKNAARAVREDRVIDPQTAADFPDRQTCGEPTCVSQLRTSGTPVQGAVAATVNMDGNLMRACAQGCEKALERLGIKDGVKILQEYFKNLKVEDPTKK